jgi:RNA polymerase-associated protein CTR9
MAGVTSNGHTNGINGTNGSQEDHAQLYPRFVDIPVTLDIPVQGEDDDEAVNLDLGELVQSDEIDELCGLLEAEKAAKIYWITISLAYAKEKNINVAMNMLSKALKAHSGARSEDRLSILACLCWMQLWKCRHAPRVPLSQPPAAGEKRDERTKDHWLHAATSTLNDASKINPSYPPLFMARGTLYLLRASLQPSKAGSESQEHSERAETIKQAAKCFDDALRARL